MRMYREDRNRKAWAELTSLMSPGTQFGTIHARGRKKIAGPDDGVLPSFETDGLALEPNAALLQSRSKPLPLFERWRVLRHSFNFGKHQTAISSPDYED